ncbi:hypothetical protein, partial [Pedobacter steynii]
CTSFSYQIGCFNQLGTASLGCFRIYRETLSRAPLQLTFTAFSLAITPDSFFTFRTMPSVLP